jgi:hypothetical protein
MKRALTILAVLVLLVLPVVGGATQEASAPQISIEHFCLRDAHAERHSGHDGDVGQS